MMMIIYLVMACLMKVIMCEDITWSPPLPCISVPSLSFQCGDCVVLQIGEKPSNISVIYSRCTQCDYYVTNGKVVSKLDQIDNIGDYGCTWARYSFFTKHPALYGACVAVITFLLLLLITAVCLRRRRSAHRAKEEDSHSNHPTLHSKTQAGNNEKHSPLLYGNPSKY